MDGGGRRHLLRRRAVRGSGELGEISSNGLGEGVRKHRGVPLVRLGVVVGGEGDQNEREKVGAWRGCSGQLRGRRASIFVFSLLAEAVVVVELGDDRMEVRGLLK
jgi:hypothetical protein